MELFPPLIKMIEVFKEDEKEENSPSHQAQSNSPKRLSNQRDLETDPTGEVNPSLGN